VPIGEKEHPSFRVVLFSDAESRSFKGRWITSIAWHEVSTLVGQ
jgi:hypothetical protein